MKKTELTNLAELRQKAVLAVKQYNLLSKSVGNSERLLLSDCTVNKTEGNIEYSKESTFIEENEIKIEQWLTSTEECEGTSYTWYDSGCSF